MRFVTPILVVILAAVSGHAAEAPHEPAAPVSNPPAQQQRPRRDTPKPCPLTDLQTTPLDEFSKAPLDELGCPK
jgi:hypothetical protein